MYWLEQGCGVRPAYPDPLNAEPKKIIKMYGKYLSHLKN